MRVRIPDQPDQIFDAIWLIDTLRIVISDKGKVVTSYPIETLEVDVQGTWMPVLQAWKKKLISFYGRVMVNDDVTTANVEEDSDEQPLSNYQEEHS